MSKQEVNRTRQHQSRKLKRHREYYLESPRLHPNNPRRDNNKRFRTHKKIGRPRKPSPTPEQKRERKRQYNEVHRTKQRNQQAEMLESIKRFNTQIHKLENEKAELIARNEMLRQQLLHSVKQQLLDLKEKKFRPNVKHFTQNPFYEKAQSSRHHNNNIKCYQCDKYGHKVAECPEIWLGSPVPPTFEPETPNDTEAYESLQQALLEDQLKHFKTDLNNQATPETSWLRRRKIVNRWVLSEIGLSHPYKFTNTQIIKQCTSLQISGGVSGEPALPNIRHQYT